MIVAMEPDSYIRPHRHDDQPKPELLTILRGSIAVLLFDDHGNVVRCVRCTMDGPSVGVEIAAGMWHGIVSLQPDTVFLETKPGPYTPIIPDDFANWAPVEGSAAAQPFLKRLTQDHQLDESTTS